MNKDEEKYEKEGRSKSGAICVDDNGNEKPADALNGSISYAGLPRFLSSCLDLTCDCQYQCCLNILKHHNDKCTAVSYISILIL